MIVNMTFDVAFVVTRIAALFDFFGDIIMDVRMFDHFTRMILKDPCICAFDEHD